jgi:hypothetical protein
MGAWSRRVLIQGRRIDTEKLALVRGADCRHPQWSRRQLSIGFCESPSPQRSQGCAHCK